MTTPKKSKLARLSIFASLLLVGVSAIASRLGVVEIAITKSKIYLVIDRVASWWNCQNSLLPSCNLASATNAEASGKNGAVVSTQQEASQVGIDILKQGGNAVDAAVAIGYALAVSDPCCGNLGGGGFMLIRLANGKETFINFRETAPLAATRDMYLDEEGKVVEGLSTQGYLAVGVPGTVKGLDYALTQYGTLKRQSIISPAIKLAQQGFVLQPGDVEIFEDGKEKLLEPNVAEIFLDQNQAVYQVGDVLKQPDLAATLQLIALKGTNAFYRGAIAQKIITASEKNGGILSLEDFANYQVSEEKPIRCDYRGYQVITSPPPGGGTTVCQMLNILSGYNLRQLGQKTPQSLHYFFSAMLFAYRDRNIHLGDPDFVNNPLDKLLSSDYADSIRKQIPAHGAIAPESINFLDSQTEGSNTTHYSVVDREGNAVAVTYTINSYFGAGVVADRTGVLLNNEMDDFTIKLGESNQFRLQQGNKNLIKPGKQPLSSMSPTIITKEDKLYLVTGSPGGSTIPTTVVQVVTNVIDYQMNLFQAVNSPRIHYQGLPNRILTEPHALTAKTIQSLQQQGYTFFPFQNWGAAESIMVDPQTGLITGVNDLRKPAGSALAY